MNSGRAEQTKASRLAAADKNFKHVDHKSTAVHTTDPMPVQDVTSTGDDTYMGTWINEAVVVHKNGRLIRRYMKLKGRQVGMAVLRPVSIALGLLVPHLRLRRCRSSKLAQPPRSGTRENGRTRVRLPAITLRV